MTEFDLIEEVPELEDTADRRERFAVAFVKCGGNGTRAASMAGCGRNSSSWGNKYLKDRDILARIEELMMAEFAASVPQLNKELKLLSQSSSPRDAVRLRAVKERLNLADAFGKVRAKTAAASKVKEEGVRKYNREELEDRAKEIFQRLGWQHSEPTTKTITNDSLLTAVLNQVLGQMDNASSRGSGIQITDRSGRYSVHISSLDQAEDTLACGLNHLREQSHG